MRWAAYDKIERNIKTAQSSGLTFLTTVNNNVHCQSQSRLSNDTNTGGCKTIRSESARAHTHTFACRVLSKSRQELTTGSDRVLSTKWVWSNSINVNDPYGQSTTSLLSIILHTFHSSRCNAINFHQVFCAYVCPSVYHRLSQTQGSFPSS